MTAELLDDPFDLDQTGPLREKRTERPLLIPRNGGERQPYTRMSTLSDFVTTNHGLHVWEKRLLSIGLALREDLCAMIAALPPLNDARCDKSTLTDEQLEQDKATKKKLDGYLTEALEAAGKNYKANWGTAVHGFVEKADATCAPERMKPDVESCLELFARHGIEVLASEIFVANDDLMAAGSFDHLVRWDRPGYGVIGVDVKTGQADGKGLQFATQVSGYMNGDVYDWHDDTRQPLEALAGGERVNRKVGLVVHIPLGGARTQLYRLDLMRGYHAAKLAANVRTARSLKDLAAPVEL